MGVGESTKPRPHFANRIRVLRLCSVFEPPPSALVGKGVKFDPIGGMQNHTAELTRSLDRRGIVQTVLTTRPPTAPRLQRLGDHAGVIRLGLPTPRRHRRSLGARRLRLKGGEEDRVSRKGDRLRTSVFGRPMSRFD
jgi:hypothetical protein